MSREAVYVEGMSESLEKDDIPLAAATKGAGLVFVSGTPPVDPETGEFTSGDIREQTRLAMEQVERSLQAAGSSLSSVLKVTIYATEPEDFAAINETYKQFWEDSYPARSFVPIKSWVQDFEIEIECVALEE